MVVREIDTRSKAGQAGLQEADVIVKVNGKNVVDVASFVHQTRSLKDGQVVRLFVRRGSSGLFLAFKK